MEKNRISISYSITRSLQVYRIIKKSGRCCELEARNEYLEMENAFAKKVGRDRATKTTLSLVRHVDRYRAIQELYDEKGYAIAALCACAVVARSAYYKWLAWTPSAREGEGYMLV